MTNASIVTLGTSEPTSRKSAPKQNPKSGEPFAKNVTYFEHDSGNFNSGTWECTAGSWEHNHPKLEFCYITEGSVKIIEEESGVTHEYAKGDAFIVPKGTRVTWVVDEYAKKIFVSAAHLESE
ncbi:Cupin domain protein [Halomonas sp. THAF5a]|uniref:cupin domain-containing protein n=1 Tax=Halomonas sp. THAF5a TaxID=2587844 RepID=UPI0012A78E50|nr:cupin domain-containing protein [Halomonas sp. THAF5a]QFU01819.1 Cupin domain protein [Halomonas sp. THAF5a]